MKKLYLFALTIFIPLIFTAQPYFNNGAKWLYGFMPSDTTNYIRIEKLGESWMGGKFCDVLKFSTYYFPQGPNPTIQYRYTYHSNDTVYIYNTGMGVFGPLYNFNLNGGDTTYCIYCSGGMIIDSVNYTAFGPLSLETQYYSAGPYTLMTYEKIGNTGYFIPDFNNQSPMGAGWLLRCYEDSTGLSYYDGFSDCNPLASVEAHDPISISVSLSNATLSSNFIQPGSEISVYDMLGNLVDHQLASQASTCALEVERKSGAVYFVTIRTGDEYISEKFVLVNAGY